MRAGVLVEEAVRAVVPRHMVLAVATKVREDLTFGTYFERLMLQSFANREQLARASGVDATTIGRWIRNEKDPDISKLRLVAPHLGVRVGDLMIRAGLATREELGMTGAPPPPGPPLRAVERRIRSRFSGPLSERKKGILEDHLNDALNTFDRILDEIEGSVREPQMRRR